MWALNGLLLVVLGTVLRKAFSAAVALGTIGFLAIDPTVAANLPVKVNILFCKSAPIVFVVKRAEGA